MTQTERRITLIKRLLDEQPRYRKISVPHDETEQRRLLRSMMNVRIPQQLSNDFLMMQDEYLREELAQRGITDIIDLSPITNGMYLWQGDITTLRCDAIVNAANSGMTGCYVPCHRCIDNCIHTYAGMQLRLECAAIMQEQGHEEETGRAKITKAYNLPCKYILHTVGPIISGPLTVQDEDLLASCYRSCLELAERHSIKSIAFCCISTGEFHFPNDRAAEIAVQTVKQYKKQHSEVKVIFNVFKDVDYKIYRNLLTAA
ncbi:MAG: protein-ADP-ribose hydrolase [Oscillospiraceae bacterium]|nr:protein-ADP-ribose hydrolase [Oscillospiraceae bacterium]